MLCDHLYAPCEQNAPLNSRSLQEGHPHSVDKDDAVEDIEFYVHYAGKRSRVVVHDQNCDLEFLNKTRVICVTVLISLQTFPDNVRVSLVQQLQFCNCFLDHIEDILPVLVRYGSANLSRFGHKE